MFRLKEHVQRVQKLDLSFVSSFREHVGTILWVVFAERDDLEISLLEQKVENSMELRRLGRVRVIVSLAVPLAAGDVRARDRPCATPTARREKCARVTD